MNVARAQSPRSVASICWAEIDALWAQGLDTQSIADRLSLNESDVWNYMGRKRSQTADGPAWLAHPRLRLLHNEK